MRYPQLLLICLTLSACLNSNTTNAQTKMEYPTTRRVEQTDDYFGTSVADPFRWLEDDVRQSDAVKEWVEAENAVTFGYLETLKYREPIRERLTELWDFEKFGTPFQRGGRYYYQKNDGLQNQYVLYQMDALDGEPTVLIDPNTWSEDGTIALAGLAFSPDGKYLAYGVQNAGSDWRTWRVLEIATKKLLDEKIEWIKFGSVSWTADSSGFYYNRYDEPTEAEKFQSVNLNQKVFYHTVGTPQSEDRLGASGSRKPDVGFWPGSDRGRQVSDPDGLGRHR